MIDLMRRWTSGIIACATSLALSGCLITNMSGGTVNGLTSVQATAQLLQQSPCVVDTVAQTTTCTPVMQVAVPGQGTLVYQFLIKLLGYAVPLHLYDPLIVQVPASMSNFAGSIAVGPPGIAPDTPLSIISGLASVPIDAHTNLVAEPGMQLVIVDFQAPDNAPSGTYTLKLQFSGTTNSIKVMFAAKITAGPTAYYVPIFPCVTNFASVPAIALPVTNPAGVIQLILSAQACAGLKSYDFSGLPTTAGVELNQKGLTGSWYEPATGGQGIELELFPDLTAPGTGLAFVSWFTFDSVIGGAERQRWYTLSGPVVSGQPSSSLTIYQNTGGNFNAPPTTASNPVGTATLSFDSCTSGLLSYNFTDGSGSNGEHTVDAPDAERDVLDHQRASDECGFRLFRELVRFRDIGPGNHCRGQSEFSGAILCLVYVCAEWHRRGAGRTTLVHGATNIHHPGAGLAYDPRATLRDHRRQVRHADEPGPQYRDGGERNGHVPELFERDVDLQLHRWQQQRQVRNDCLEPCRTGAGWLCAMRGNTGLRFSR